VPFDVGEVMVATTEPHDHAVLRAIHEHGLDLQLVFNKGAVMVLPPRVTKASGLDAALVALGHTSDDVIAVGDAENDIALPSVKDAADVVTRGARGVGIVELVEWLLAGDADDAGREDAPFVGSARQP
jgi:hydroxymethylpyrimidine pyrophosphatase-like HAD family hydrolase